MFSNVLSFVAVLLFGSLVLLSLFLFSHLFLRLKLSEDVVSINFLEASHGKGVL